MLKFEEETMKILPFILFLTMGPEVESIPLSSFYNYGTSAGDATLSRRDDGYSPLIILFEYFPFYGGTSNLLFVS